MSDMKRNFLIAFSAVVVIVLNSCSSPYKRGEFPFFHGVGRTISNMELLFHDTEYPMIDDEDIVKVEVDGGYKNGGEFRRVTYKYGMDTCVNVYYVDKDGDMVKVRQGAVKDTGYPYADSILYRINRHGDVVFDYLFVIGLTLFIILIYRVLTT